MNTLFENAALLLGLAISLYTVYSAVDSYLIRRRRRMVTRLGLLTRLKYLFTLAGVFSKMADKTTRKYTEGRVRDKDKLPEDAHDDVELLLLHGSHLIDFDVNWDLEKLGDALTTEQLGAFLEFMKIHLAFREVLTVRVRHVENFPDLAKPLAFLNTATAMNLEKMHQKYDEFEGLMQAGRK